MAITISGAAKNSPAQKLNIEPGCKLVSVNAKIVNDLLDYGFYTAADRLELVIENRQGNMRVCIVEKGEYDELGFESESFLMDKQHSCRNKCIFCFIDQMPKGLRDTLYFKDDDERLSFLFGNYITLTNLGDAEIERIIEMKISPVNISVHTTNEELRCRMMGNRCAGEKLQYLYRLAEGGVDINCQIVLCKGINDGEELKSSLQRLAGLYPSVRSVACVPAGLTAHRQGLAELIPYDKASASEVLDIIDDVNAACREEHGVGLVYPADELLLLAERSIPPLGYYDELLQLENGVGMLALFEDEFMAVFEDAEQTSRQVFATAVTGELAAPAISRLVELAKKKAPNTDCKVISVKNEFFGGNVTVAGLLTAKDIHKQLKNSELFGDILITGCMLRSERDMFLDSVTVGELAEMLGRKIKTIDSGIQLAQLLLGIENEN